MAAEARANATDDYVVARLAMWAGDFDHAARLLSRFAPQHEYGAFPDAVSSTEDLIRYAAALRRRQLAQKSGEFSKLSEELRIEGAVLVYQPEVITTTHLRGAIWRVGIRQFQMRAYLSDLTWEDGLLRAARALIAQSDDSQVPLPKTAGVSRTQRKPFVGQGGSWVSVGNPFVEIALSDLGLIEADAVWTEGDRPRSVEPIRGKFRSILEQLDGGEREPKGWQGGR